MADNNGKFFRETPVGNLYGGYLKNYPLARGGDLNSAWLGLGNNELIANNYNLPGQNPTYNLGMNLPNGAALPNYYGEINTPLGMLYGGTDDRNPNVNVGFQPNDTTSAYINALKSLLNR